MKAKPTSKQQAKPSQNKALASKPKPRRPGFKTGAEMTKTV